LYLTNAFPLINLVSVTDVLTVMMCTNFFILQVKEPWVLVAVLVPTLWPSSCVWACLGLLNALWKLARLEIQAAALLI
jgi:hypothetical protein